MDAPEFDALSKALSTGNTRRRVLGALAVAPALGGVFGLLARDDADARNRRKAHGHGLAADKKRKKKKRKKACVPQPVSQTCAGKCGAVTDNCTLSVNCGPCTCTPSCAGKCAGGSDGCGGTCDGSCGANQICDNGSCQECDVCATGCPFTTMREAVNDASAGETLYVCPGTYQRFEDGEVASIEKNLTVIGAGPGEDGTIFDGGGAESSFVVVEINDATAVELRNLMIKGGNRTQEGAGLRVRRSTVILTQVRVTGNTATVGAGIVNEDHSHLTLTASNVTGNTAPDAAGILNFATLVIGAGTNVSDNNTGDCENRNEGTGCPG